MPQSNKIRVLIKGGDLDTWQTNVEGKGYEETQGEDGHLPANRDA